MRALYRFLLLNCLLTGLHSSAADFRLNLTRNTGGAALELVGEPGTEYLLEKANDSADHWTVHSSFMLNDPSRIWSEALVGSRFFRARTTTEADAQYAENFRLIDQKGKARELFYYKTLDSLRGIVLIFTEGNYAEFATKIQALKAQPNFADTILFWTIDTSVSKARAQIVADAAAAGIDWPVLHDPGQMVTREFKANFNGEALAITRHDMRVVYRGRIDDSVGVAAPVNAYLATALSNILEFEPIITTRFEPSENALALTPTGPIADYSTVIAPLLQTKCVVCHSPGNIGPFALTNYDAVVENSLHMKEEVMARNMPPWHADPLYGKFRNDISLSADETKQLIEWIDAGMPRGTGPDPLTVLPEPPSEWPVELGPPDQIVTIPVQDIPAIGPIDYRYIYTTTTNPEGHWLRAAVVKPSNRHVVHHYIVWTGRSTFPLLSGIAAYAPGRTEGAFPEGTGVYLSANQELTFNCHYMASGMHEMDQPTLGLWYAKGADPTPLKTAVTINPHFTLLDTISIPAGDPEFEIKATNRFSSAVRLFSLSPHMHLRGLRMRFDLVLPGSPAKQTLLSAPNYNFEWQTIYYLEQPLDLPAGAQIEVVGAFDNSAQNLFNPDPTKDIFWGPQSWDEMFIGYMEYINP